ncbi:HAD family hydrolase [Streptomyces sp. NPDC058268]|uniref:HAD family hydrolase n=1 Tax=Streptomyces sp. NPDC058268 TaxID=3346413 RepID=UPI0036E74B87
MTLPMPRAVVFDCDGTLADTHACVRTAVDEAFARRGRTCDRRFHAELCGLGLAALSARVATMLDVSPVGLDRELLTTMVQQAKRWAVTLSGARECAEATAARLPVAIASNSPRLLLDATLTATGLSRLTSVTISADDVARPKPAPDMYVQACRALSVCPCDAVAVEDSPTGITAARAAGMTVIGVGEHARNAEADHWLPALSPDTFHERGPLRSGAQAPTATGSIFRRPPVTDAGTPLSRGAHG